MSTSPDKAQAIKVKARDLADLYDQAIELRKQAIKGHGRSIVRNTRAIKRELDDVMGALNDLNEKWMPEGQMPTGKEAMQYNRARLDIENETIEIKQFMIPIEDLDAVDGITALAYCPVMVWDEDGPLWEEPDA